MSGLTALAKSFQNSAQGFQKAPPHRPRPQVVAFRSDRLSTIPNQNNGQRL